MLMKSVAAQWSNVELATANDFLVWREEKREKRIYVLFSMEHMRSTQDRAGRRFLWILTNKAAQRSKNSVRRSWMPKEAIVK